MWARPSSRASRCFGGGDSYTLNMVVLQKDDAVVTTTPGDYTDVSAAAASQGGSEFSGWLSANTDSCLYIGGPRKFPGIKLLSGATGSSTALDRTEVALEYYNANTASWIEVTRMATKSSRPYNSTATEILSDTSYSEQVRFGMRDTVLDRNNDAGNLSTRWDEIDVGGTTQFWVRLRLVSGITGIPTIEQIKLHVDRFEINDDGFTERFGGVVRSFPWGLGNHRGGQHRQ